MRRRREKRAESREDHREVDVRLEVNPADKGQIGPPFDERPAPRSRATSDDALAASTTKLAPERSSRSETCEEVAFVS